MGRVRESQLAACPTEGSPAEDASKDNPSQNYSTEGAVFILRSVL